MTTIDVDSYLEPVSDDLLCGENLEYDMAFGALEREARGKEERFSGDKKIPAEEPKWREVYDAAEALMARTRDLRVVTHLTHAALNIEGLPGLAGGLRLIHGLLERYWDSVHPQLDKDDDDDPTLRLNSLVALNDREGIVRSLLRAPLVESRAAGRYSYRSMLLAKGELSPAENEQVPDSALIDAAFLDADLDALKETAEAAKEAAAALDMIDALLRERVGSGRAVDLGNLSGELRAIRAVLAAQLQRRGVGDGADKTAGNGLDGGAPGIGVPAAVGEIRSRDDAVRVLEQVAEYFRKNEPSSPVPLLLDRAKRLVAKDFMEILRDLTPDGVSQAEAIGGLNRDE